MVNQLFKLESIAQKTLKFYKCFTFFSVLISEHILIYTECYVCGFFLTQLLSRFLFYTFLVNSVYLFVKIAISSPFLGVGCQVFTQLSLCSVGNKNVDMFEPKLRIFQVRQKLQHQIVITGTPKQKSDQSHVVTDLKFNFRVSQHY